MSFSFPSTQKETPLPGSILSSSGLIDRASTESRADRTTRSVTRTPVPPLTGSSTPIDSQSSLPSPTNTTGVLPTNTATSTNVAAHKVNATLPVVVAVGGFILLCVPTILFVRRKMIHTRAAVCAEEGLSTDVQENFDEGSPVSEAHQPIEKTLGFIFGEVSGAGNPVTESAPDEILPTSIDFTESRMQPSSMGSGPPPRYSMERNGPFTVLGDRRRGRRIARDGGVLLIQGLGVEEMRRRGSIRSVETDFSIGTVPSSSGSTLPPPYGQYDG